MAQRMVVQSTSASSLPSGADKDPNQQQVQISFRFICEGLIIDQMQIFIQFLGALALDVEWTETIGTPSIHSIFVALSG